VQKWWQHHTLRVGKQQSHRVAADTLLMWGWFALNFLYAPSSFKCFIVILELWIVPPSCETNDGNAAMINLLRDRITPIINELVS